MKLFLTSAYSTHTGLDILRQYAALDSVGNHCISDNPEEADAILFVENTQFDDILFRTLLNHELIQKYPEKVFMYNEMDRPWDVLPGLYCCMTRKHINTDRHAAFAYLYTPNPYIKDIHTNDIDKQWLYSFMGSMSHSCRRTVMKLDHPDGYVQDTSEFNVWRSDDAELAARGQSYAHNLAESQFILCPRGIGCSSIRLYETLEAGRVPVIISDDWVPPAETDWSFAIKVEERRIASIPGILKSLQGESEERGYAARQAWEASYAPQTLFNTVGESLSVLVEGEAYRHKSSQGASLQKWITTGGLFTRSAAQRLRGG